MKVRRLCLEESLNDGEGVRKRQLHSRQQFLDIISEFKLQGTYNNGVVYTFLFSGLGIL